MWRAVPASRNPASRNLVNRSLGSRITRRIGRQLWRPTGSNKIRTGLDSRRRSPTLRSLAIDRQRRNRTQRSQGTARMTGQ
jgi:hypothetical protein